MSLRRLSRLVVLGFVLVVAAALGGNAHASELIDRNATQVKLEVSPAGQALLSYRARGAARRVLVWGAVNALPPSTSRPQVAFRLDYSGNVGPFANACRPYDGPALFGLVKACKAPDGSYWAVQTWQRGLPNFGAEADAKQAADELRISHWTGPVAKLEVGLDWVYSGRFHHVFGRLTYRDEPVHGFRSTSVGVPLDTYGRNLYLDTYNSAYGGGWRREISFLAHNPNGNFCYGFFGGRPDPRALGGAKLQGNGERYRLSVIGPGVTPDIRWEGQGLPSFDRANPDHAKREREMNAWRVELAAGDRGSACRNN